ncbi:hypothetical protein JL39_23335 [Rhizobium sp. YS-1r]|nr:hypothetical protein JL39_23335 [Rhizobium sp. YS-1r]
MIELEAPLPSLKIPALYLQRVDMTIWLEDVLRPDRRWWLSAGIGRRWRPMDEFVAAAGRRAEGAITSSQAR